MATNVSFAFPMIAVVLVASWPCGVSWLSKLRLPPNAAFMSASTPARTSASDGATNPVTPKDGAGTLVVISAPSPPPEPCSVKECHVGDRAGCFLDQLEVGERPAVL